jgi:nucleotide-binding universal stress UspA family protein
MRIAVGFQVSTGGLAGLAWAAEEAMASGGHLTVCHVRAHGDERTAAPDLETLSLTRPDLVRYIRSCRQRVGGANVTVELPLSGVVPALLELSERSDLLVVGGRHGADPPHRGVPARLAAQARCAVVVVRPVRCHDGAPFSGHVVIGVDGSRASTGAIRLGFEHARRHHLPVAAVHVDDHRPEDFWFDDRFLETHFATEPAALELLARGLEPTAADFRTVPVKRAVYGGDVVTGMRRAATGAALLVLGRHGHRRPAPLRLGSVSRAFAEHADCVVAVVPGDEPA